MPVKKSAPKKKKKKKQTDAAKAKTLLAKAPPRMHLDIKSAAVSLFEYCNYDKDKLMLLLVDDEAPSVRKIAKDPMVNWTIGYAQAVEDIYKIRLMDLVPFVDKWCLSYND